MRKIKKINGYLIVKFNDREKRVYEGTDLGEYGVIEAELYTGRLNIDRSAMKCDTAGTLEEAVELARGLETEVDLTEEPATYTILTENGDTVSEKEVEPWRMIQKEQSGLEDQVKNSHCPEVDECSAVHQLYGYKSAFCDLGLLHEDDRFVSPDTFSRCVAPDFLPDEPEELLSCVCDKVCRQRLPGRTQKELDAVCAKCAVQKLAKASIFETAKQSQVSEKRNFKNLDPKMKNDPLIQEVYRLGVALEDDCPNNDCTIYHGTFCLAQELDTAMDGLNGYPAFVLRRDLRNQIRYLLKMYRENHAVRKYCQRWRGTDVVVAGPEKEPGDLFGKVYIPPRDKRGICVSGLSPDERFFKGEARAPDVACLVHHQQPAVGIKEKGPPNRQTARCGGCPLQDKKREFSQLGEFPGG